MGTGLRFGHADTVWDAHPGLVPGVLMSEPRDLSVPVDDGAVTDLVERYQAMARDRLGDETESALPQIQAWRRAFARMGLKPTQYRCAAESLLRRFRKDGALPRLHPLVDLGNAVSVAYAIPVAVLDVAHIAGDLVVRPAHGDEDYVTFGGEHEHPEPGEIVFADDAGCAHARRWTNRQSGLSAMQPTTRQVLIVAEAMHDDARDDVRALVADLRAAVAATWAPVRSTHVLTRSEPMVELGSTLPFEA